MDAVQQAEKNEECRREVRAYLADRPSVALSAGTIRRGLQAEWNYNAEEITNALGFLRSLDQVAQTRAELGSTLYYRISATGTLAHERG